VNHPSIAITPVDAADDQPVLRERLEGFHDWIAERAPDSYVPEEELAEDVRTQEREPESWAWIARFEGAPAGCVLLYGETDDLAEFRRLWVEPDCRGEGVGRALTRTVIEAARARGYGTLGLTTPPWSERAQVLYESLGFERTDPYPETRLPERYHEEAIFMQLDL